MLARINLSSSGLQLVYISSSLASSFGRFHCTVSLGLGVSVLLLVQLLSGLARINGFPAGKLRKKQEIFGKCWEIVFFSGSPGNNDNNVACFGGLSWQFFLGFVFSGVGLLGVGCP